MLFVGVIFILLRRHKPVANPTVARSNKPVTDILIFTILGLFAASMAWTSGSQVEAVNSLSKYGKLLIIPIFCVLIKNRKEALMALASFAVGQIFLIISAWMLFIKIPVPWALSQSSLSHNVVFSSYLDEGLMSAVVAAVSWHLKTLLPGRNGRYCAMAVCVLARGPVFFLRQGRSAHIAAILLLTLAVMWQMPRKYRLIVVILPFLLATVLYVSSAKVQSRLDSLNSEVQTFSFRQGVDVNSGNSSGIRLHFWHRALQSIVEHPLVGSGAGSWSKEFNRLERMANPAHGDIQPLGNPHQEYLLWGVQLGVPGILLLLALMLSIWKDTLTMDTPTARATQSALLALAIACLFNSSIYDAQIGDFFCVVLGLLLAMGRQSQIEAQLLHHPPKITRPA